MDWVYWMTLENDKVEKYVALVLDQKSLVRASTVLIRRKHSPLAIAIRNGDSNAIYRAARDRIAGGLNLEQRKKFCQLICKFREKVQMAVGSLQRREAIGWMINAAIGLVETLSGLFFSFLWAIRGKLYEVICRCPLDSTCQNDAGACQHSLT